MKKIFLAIIIVISILIFSPSVLADTPTLYLGIDVAKFIPGLNCGLAGSPGKDSCCWKYVPPTIQQPNTNGLFDTIIGIIKDPIIRTIDTFWTPLVNLFNGAVVNVPSCSEGVQSISDANDPNCKCINPITPSPGYLSALNDFCQRQSSVADRNACLACSNDGGVFSGIGCVKTDIKKFIGETVFGLGIGLAGGFSLLCIIYAAFMMQSSQGNPEKLKKAQEMITSCIMGLMLVIFSVFILKLIGVNILKIPGFV